MPIVVVYFCLFAEQIVERPLIVVKSLRFLLHSYKIFNSLMQRQEYLLLPQLSIVST